MQFHVQGNISNYTADQIEIIKETVAAIVGCDNEEIHLNGFCNSFSFFIVLSMKERYVNSLFNMKQQDKETLIGLNINYLIVDSDHVYLKNPKGKLYELDLKTDHFMSGVSSIFNLSVRRPYIFDLSTTCSIVNKLKSMGEVFCNLKVNGQAKVDHFKTQNNKYILSYRLTVINLIKDKKKEKKIKP